MYLGEPDCNCSEEIVKVLVSNEYENNTAGLYPLAYFTLFVDMNFSVVGKTIYDRTAYKLVVFG